MPCLPAWHFAILEVAARTKALGQLRVPGCPQSLGDAGNVVPCKVEHMRAAVEQRLQQAKLWSGPLSLTVYAMARNIMSEVGGDATPEEMVAIAEAAVHRHQGDPGKWHTVEAQLMKEGRNYDAPDTWRFGRQRGQNPAAATSQDPLFVHLYVADLVLRGQSENFTQGATLYFDSLAQNAVRRRCLAEGGTNCATAAADVLTDWTANGHATWIGPLPGINPRKLMLFVSGAASTAPYRTPAGRATWARQLAAARAALVSEAPDERKTVYDLPPCPGAGPLSASTTGALAVLAAVGGVAAAAAASIWLARAWRTTRYLPKSRPRA